MLLIIRKKIDPIRHSHKVYTTEQDGCSNDYRNKKASHYGRSRKDLRKGSLFGRWLRVSGQLQIFA